VERIWNQWTISRIITQPIPNHCRNWLRQSKHFQFPHKFFEDQSNSKDICLPISHFLLHIFICVHLRYHEWWTIKFSRFSIFLFFNNVCRRITDSEKSICLKNQIIPFQFTVQNPVLVKIIQTTHNIYNLTEFRSICQNWGKCIPTNCWNNSFK
jgi:hypothetical protein